MKKLIIIMCFILITGCNKNMFMDYPEPLYENPDRIEYSDLSVTYHWLCLDGVHVVITYEYKKGKWIKYRQDLPGICMYDFQISN